MGCRSFSLSPNLKSNDFGGRKGVGGNRQGSSPALIQKQVCTGRGFLRKLFLPCKLVQLGEMPFFAKLRGRCILQRPNDFFYLHCPASQGFKTSSNAESLTNSGIWSMGASTVIVWPPSYPLPVQTSVQFTPSGRYTLRSRCSA